MSDEEIEKVIEHLSTLKDTDQFEKELFKFLMDNENDETMSRFFSLLRNGYTRCILNFCPEHIRRINCTGISCSECNTEIITRFKNAFNCPSN